MFKIFKKGKTFIPVRHISERNPMYQLIYNLLNTSHPTWTPVNTPSSTRQKISFIPILPAASQHKRYVQQTYRGADKSLARPDWKIQLKIRHFSSEADVVAASETWLDGKCSEFLLLSGLQELEFGRCSLHPSWSG